MRIIIRKIIDEEIDIDLPFFYIQYLSEDSTLYGKYNEDGLYYHIIENTIGFFEKSYEISTGKIDGSYYKGKPSDEYDKDQFYKAMNRAFEFLKEINI